jgi:hypothetical protein
MHTAVWCPDAHAALAAAQPAYGFSNEAAIAMEEKKYDENLMTPDLKSFMELLEKKGSNITLQELEGPRSKVGGRAQMGSEPHHHCHQTAIAQIVLHKQISPSTHNTFCLHSLLTIMLSGTI